MSPAKMAEMMEMPFGVWSSGDPCIRWGPDPPTARGTAEGV